MRVDVDGLRIAYERAGTGPAVVLAHGFVGDAGGTWRAQIDALSDEFTVIAWDAPGAGGSTDPPESFGMDAYADCLAGFLRALRIEQAHLVGLSFGAALVLAASHRHPGLATSLTLVSGYAGWRGSLGTEEADQRLARSLEASQLTPDEFVAAMAPSMFSPSADVDLVAPALDSIRAFHPVGFRAMARASYADQRHVLAEVDVPTLLLYADHDVRAPVAVGEAIHRAVPRSELVVLAGAGHASPVEAPVDVTRELRRFLRSVEQGRRDHISDPMPARVAERPCDSMRVRPATPDDLEACLTIVRGLPDFFTDDVPDKIADDLDAHHGWVITTDDAVVGFAVVRHRSSRAAEILWAAVRDDQRNQGVGATLLDRVLRALAADNMALVEVKTLDASDDYEPYIATRAFWERHGFIQIDTIDPLPGWPPGNPAAIYVCALTSTREPA